MTEKSKNCPSIWSLFAVVVGNVKLGLDCVDNGAKPPLKVDKGAKPPLKEVVGVGVDSTGSAGNVGSASGAVSVAGVSVATGVIWAIRDEDVAGAFSDGAECDAGGFSWRSSVGT